MATFFSGVFEGASDKSRRPVRQPGRGSLYAARIPLRYRFHVNTGCIRAVLALHRVAAVLPNGADGNKQRAKGSAPNMAFSCCEVSSPAATASSSLLPTASWF